MSTKGFLSTLKPLDAQRLQKSVKATVQNSGRLTFAMDAVKDMELSEDKSIIILAAEDGNLGAVISHKGDPEAFALKKCGAYFYVSFKNYLQQAGVDYKNQRVVYDITELDETYKGRTLYKFERRLLPKNAKDDSDDETADRQESEETPSAAPEGTSTPSEEAGATTIAKKEPSATEGVPAANCGNPRPATESDATPRPENGMTEDAAR